MDAGLMETSSVCGVEQEPMDGADASFYPKALSQNKNCRMMSYELSEVMNFLILEVSTNT
jgi:hypothetical protein